MGLGRGGRRDSSHDSWLRVIQATLGAVVRASASLVRRVKEETKLCLDPLLCDGVVLSCLI